MTPAIHQGIHTYVLLIRCLTLIVKVTMKQWAEGYLYMELLAHVLYLLSLVMNDFIWSQ